MRDPNSAPVSAMDAINAVLIQKWPERYVYVGFVPKDFKRPSFLLERVMAQATQHTRHTVKKTEYFVITCFVPINVYGQQEQLALLILQDEVMALFSSGAITAGDRAFEITASIAGSDLGEAYIDLTVTYADTKAEDRPEFEKIQKINIDYRRDE
ncbi:MAG TPA: hypothetical protein PKX46_00065 [Clostridia bacterium]|nr:hypothetical protein [Clostridia bacterium]